METTYNDIVISYQEANNRWHFELRGRKRSAESLAAAKNAIDKEPAAKRKQEFPRFHCYQFKYNDEVEIVTVTSVAEDGYRGLEFWVSSKEGRAKVRANMLNPANESNGALVEEIKALTAERARIFSAITEARSKLTIAEIPAEIAS